MAQKDTTKKNQAVTITTEYKPVLRPAAKINFSGTQLATDTQVTVRPYMIPSQNLFYSYQPVSLRPLALQSDTLRETGNMRYIKAGFGNYTTPVLQAGWGFSNSDRSLFTVQADYISSQGKISNQDYSIFNIKGTAGYQFEKSELQLAAVFNRSRYYLYGYDHNVYAYEKSAIRQDFQDMLFRAGFRNSVKNSVAINYHPTLEIGFFSNYKRVKEASVKLRAPVNRKFGEKFKFELAPYLDYNNYNTLGIFPAIKNLDNTVVAVPLSLQYQSSLLDIRAGMAPSWDNGKFSVLPDIHAEFMLADKGFIIQGGWKGSIIKNSYRNLANQNPYLETLLGQLNTKETEFYGGIKLGFGSHFYLDAKVGMLTYQNLALWINDTANDEKTFMISYEPTANNFRIQGHLSYITGQKFSAIAGLTINGYTGINANARAWHTLPFELSAALRWKILKELQLKADFHMFGGASYLAKGNDISQLDPGTDLSIGAIYKINKHFSAWLDVNNVLNNKYQRWYRYEVYGLNLLAGIRYEF